MSVTATIQSEWMSHIEGKPIPDAENAHLLSTSRGPVVFFINKLNSHLVVLKPAKSGGQEVLDLTSLWALKDKVTCLATTQGLDGSVFLFFATANTQSGLNDKLYSIDPVVPQNFEDEAKWKASLRCYTPTSSPPGSSVVQSIALGSTGVFQRTAAVVYKVDNVWAAIRLTLELEYDKNVQTSRLRAEKIEFAVEANSDVAPRLIPGRFGRQSGLYFCFPSSKGSKFGFRQDDGITIKFYYPNGHINSMQVVYDLQHTGHILIETTTGLLMYSYSRPTYYFNWSTPYIYPRTISKQTVSHVRVVSTPDSRKTSIWMKMGDKLDGLGYIETDHMWQNQSEEPAIVPLVNDNVASFSASFAPNGSLRGVLYHRIKGSSSLLERSSTGLWSDVLFELPVPSVVKTTPAYVSHIKLSSDDSAALHGARFLLSSTSPIAVLVNEEPYTIDEKPQLVEVDQQGKIEIVNLIEGLQTPNFVLQNTSEHTMLEGNVVLDPAHRVKKRLRKRSSPDDLRKLTVGGSDKKMFAESTDFDQLSLVLRAMYKEMDELPKDGTRKIDIAPLERHETASWSFLHAIEATVDNLHDLAVQGGHLLITIAGKIIGFVLDCFETALKAVSTVLTAAGAALDDLQHWLGFVFDWDEIVATHTSLSTVFNYTISTPDHYIEKAFEWVEKPLATIMARCSAGQQLKSEYKQATSNIGSLKKEVSDLKTSKFEPTSTMSHPAIDYVLNKLGNLLATDTIKVRLDFEDDTMSSISGLFDTLKKIYNEFGTDIHAISSGQHISLSKILGLLGEAILSSIVETIQGMVLKLKKVLTSMLRVLPDIMNKPRAIPLLSALYKYATGSATDPSLLQITALVIAIPVSICCKIFQSTSFPSFTTDALAILFNDPTQTKHALEAPTIAVEVQAMLMDSPYAFQQPESTWCVMQRLPHPLTPLDPTTAIPEHFTGPKGAPVCAEKAPDTVPKADSKLPHFPSVIKFYTAAIPHLTPWIKEQPRTLGWIDLVHTIINTLTIALPELPSFHTLESDALDAGTITIDRLTVVNTIIQGYSILASLPMIPSDRWNKTPAVSLRFEAWGIDSVLKVLEIFTAWRSVRDDSAVTWNKSLILVRNVISAVMWTLVAEAEHDAHFADATEDDIAKAKKLAIWSISEYMVLCAGHIAPAAVMKTTPPNVRGVIALTTFGLGVAGNASRWTRAELHGDSESCFSAGFA